MNTACWILAGGPEQGVPCIAVPKDAFVLCADSGLRLAERLGITPVLVMGDFDSLGEIPKQPHIQAPMEKDDTDTILAVRYGLAQGYRSFVICGAFGGRLDHSFANIQTLLFLRQQGAEGVLAGVNDLVSLQGAGPEKRYPRREGDSFSVFSLTEQCEGVCIRGVKYPLESGILTMYHPLGVSNSIIEEEAVLSCQSGILLVVQSRLQ